MFSFAPFTLISSFHGFFLCFFYDCLYTRREYVSHSSMLETHSSSIIVFDGSLFSYSSLGIFFIVLSDISPPQPQHTGCAILQNASSFPSNCAAGLPLSERWNEPGFVYATIQTMVGDCMCAGSIEKTLTIMRDERDGGEGTAMMSTNMGFFGVLSLFFPFKPNWNLWSFVALVFFQVLFQLISA